MSKLSKETIKGLVMEVLGERKAVVSEGRVTKSDLQRIIKEEYSAMVSEIQAGEDNIPKSVPPPVNVGGTGHSGNIPPETPSFRENYEKFRNALEPIWALFGKGVPLKEEVKDIIQLAVTTSRETEAQREAFINTLKRRFESMEEVLEFLKNPEA